MRTKYTHRLRPETIAGEPGWSYSVFVDGREIFGGWSRGSKAGALDEIRAGLSAREALHRAAGLERVS